MSLGAHALLSTAQSREELSALSVPALRRLAQSWGVSTLGFAEKSEFVEALQLESEARAARAAAAPPDAQHLTPELKHAVDTAAAWTRIGRVDIDLKSLALKLASGRLCYAPECATETSGGQGTRACIDLAAAALREMLICGGCRSAVYCSEECQRADWAAHKPLCRTRRAAVARGNATAALQVLVLENSCRDEAKYAALLAEGADAAAPFTLSPGLPEALQGELIAIVMNQATALHVAAERNNTPALRAMLGAGVPVDTVRGADGWTALRYAVVECHFEAVELLLQHGAVIDAPVLAAAGDKGGWGVGNPTAALAGAGLTTMRGKRGSATPKAIRRMLDRANRERGGAPEGGASG